MKLIIAVEKLILPDFAVVDLLNTSSGNNYIFILQYSKLVDDPKESNRGV